MDTIGTRLKAERLANKLTQEDLAKEAGVSKQAVSNIERGETKEPEAKTLDPIARQLNVTAKWLLDGRPPKRPGSSQSVGFDFARIIRAQKFLIRYLEILGEPEELRDDAEHLRAAYDVVEQLERETAPVDLGDFAKRLRERMKDREESADGTERREAIRTGGEDGRSDKTRARKAKASAR